MKTAILTVSIVCLIFASNVFAVLSGGGTQGNPYLIQSRADFDEFANPANSAIYWTSGVYTKLTCNLNLSDTTYTQAVIAPDTDGSNFVFDGTPFTGVFDGGGHKITGLVINGGMGNFVGLFGNVGSGGQIKELGVEGSVNGNSGVGCLVGYNECGNISSCYSSGSVIGNGYDIGGLAGINGGVISNCYSSSSVNGTGGEVGGLLGNNYFGTVENCYSSGSVNGSTEVGGLLGYDNYGVVLNCFWDIESSGKGTSAGGTGLTTEQMKQQSSFVDWDFENIWRIPFCAGYPVFKWNILSVAGSGTEGDPYQISEPEDLFIVGQNPCLYDANFVLTKDIDMAGQVFTAAIIAPDTSVAFGFQGTAFTGVFDGCGHKITGLVINGGTGNFVGLFGNVGSGGQIKKLGVEGSVNGNSGVGCLVGYNECGNISNCYSSGSVIGNGYDIGGFAGISGGVISNCYSRGSVNGDYVGGLLGNNYFGTVENCYSTGSVNGSTEVGGLLGYDNYGVVLNCFWDIESSGKGTSAGGTGLTTEQMKQQSSFGGWDFDDLWSICEGTNYPRLTWQIPAWDYRCPDGCGFEDYSVLAGSWRQENADINLAGEAIIDFEDMLVICENWLEGRI